MAAGAGRGGAGVVMTDDDYVSAALGVCRKRHQYHQQQGHQQQWLRLRAVTRENLSGPARFAPSFAGDAPPPPPPSKLKRTQNESSQPQTCDCFTVNAARSAAAHGGGAGVQRQRQVLARRGRAPSVIATPPLSVAHWQATHGAGTATSQRLMFMHLRFLEHSCAINRFNC